MLSRLYSFVAYELRPRVGFSYDLDSARTGQFKWFIHEEFKHTKMLTQCIRQIQLIYFTSIYIFIHSHVENRYVVYMLTSVFCRYS